MFDNKNNNNYSPSQEPAAEMEEPAATVEEAAPVDGASEEKRSVQRDRHTIFVGNLPFDTADADVRELFSQQGKVELISVPKDKLTGQPRGFAFVDMSSDEEVQAAVAAYDGNMFEGRVLRVTKSVPKEEVEKKAPKKRAPAAGGKIYVGNLPFDTTKEDLMAYYTEQGEVVEVYIPVNPATGTGRGYAFVTMKEEDVEKAIEATNGIEFMGRPLVANIPLPPGEKAQNPRSNRTKLYVGNLSFYTVVETLTELFEEFGTVIDCYLPEDPATGGSRGFGFVTMDKDSAFGAIDELDGCELDGRIIRVNEAQPKGRGSFNNNDNFETQE
jgi:nucleolin